MFPLIPVFSGVAVGVGSGESIESKLMAMMKPFLPEVRVEVHGIYLSRTWTITFYNAPWYLPPLVVLSDSLSESVSESVEQQGARTTTLVAQNKIEGSFRLQFGGRVTEYIYHNASAMALKSRLEALPNVHQVSVVRSGPNLLDAYAWTVTFFATEGEDVLLVVLVGGAGCASINHVLCCSFFCSRATSSFNGSGHFSFHHMCPKNYPQRAVPVSLYVQRPPF